MQRNQLVARRKGRPPLIEVAHRPFNGDLQVREVNRLGDEIERTAIHRGADVLHIAIGGNNHRANVGVDLGNLLEQRQPVHLRHIDVREDHVDFVVFVQTVERFQTVVSKDELVLAAPDTAPHALQHERLEVRLVVNDEDFAWPIRHAQLPF